MKEHEEISHFKLMLEKSLFILLNMKYFLFFFSEMNRYIMGLSCGLLVAAVLLWRQLGQPQPQQQQQQETQQRQPQPQQQQQHLQANRVPVGMGAVRR